MTKTNNMSFDDALKGFIGTVSRAKEFALACSLMAIREFEKSGNLDPAQRFLDAMNQHAKNFVRGNAFVIWMAAHSPAILEEGKFKKDKSDEARPFNITGAMLKPFWDFAPEKPIVNFSYDDVLSDLLARLKKWGNEKRYHAAHKADAAVVAEVSIYLENLAAKYAANPPADDEEVENVETANLPAVIDVEAEEVEQPQAEAA